jgi:competence protein ComEC
VAGLATAPVAAASFNRLAEYGLLANILSVPLMGSVVMPAAILAGVLSPFGLGWIGLRVMELGTLWILGVAHWVAALAGAVVPVAAPPGWALPVLALGAIWLMLWPGRARWAGLVPMALALALWGQGARPALLVADTGTLIGVLGPEGRTLSKATGERFAAEQWLQSDGDAAPPEDAAARPALSGPPGRRVFSLGQHPGIHLTGRGAALAVDDACRTGVLVILGAEAPAVARMPPGPDGLPRGPGGCWLIDGAHLAGTGALALDVGRDGALRLQTATARAGRRPWTGG